MNEPVAWYSEYDSSLSFKKHSGDWIPLYTHPVKEQEIEKLIGDLRNVAEAQGQKGCWDYDQYMLGLFNGLELALAIFEKRKPQYRELPSHPVKELALTDEEMISIYEKDWSGIKCGLGRAVEQAIFLKAQEK